MTAERVCTDEDLCVLYVGLQVLCDDFVIGETVTCDCSSDVYSTDIDWYMGNATISSVLSNGTYSINIPVTTDSHGDVYTCGISTECGDQDISNTVDITGN
jgi:hypothetical protein